MFKYVFKNVSLIERQLKEITSIPEGSNHNLKLWFDFGKIKKRINEDDCKKSLRYG